LKTKLTKLTKLIKLNKMNSTTKDIISIVIGIIILINIRTIIYAYLCSLIFILEKVLLLIINILELFII
jgi:hypothetical protein